MANKYLKKKLSLRENILLLVLFAILVLGLYFGLVFYPIRSRTAELNNELNNVEVQINLARIEKQAYDDMKAELERIQESGDTTVMPQYKNNEQQEVLAACFTTIFAGMNGHWTIQYGGEPALNDGIRTRNVSFSFTVDESTKGAEATVYDKARSVLVALMTTGFRCSMSYLFLSPGEDGLEEAKTLSVACTISFYELDS